MVSLGLSGDIFEMVVYTEYFHDGFRSWISVCEHDLDWAAVMDLQPFKGLCYCHCYVAMNCVVRYLR